MKKRNRIILILFILILFPSIFLPFVYRNENETINQTINIIATLISSIASLFTLFIAIALFNKYGIETTLLQKNTEVVFSFLEEYKKINFCIKGKNFVLFIKIQNNLTNQYNEWLDQKLCFSTEYISNLEKLFKISRNPFMPKSIHEKANKLKIDILTLDIREEEINNYAIVGFMENSLFENKIGRFNGHDMTLSEFIKIVDELTFELENWIKKNSNYNPDLNL